MLNKIISDLFQILPRQLLRFQAFREIKSYIRKKSRDEYCSSWNCLFYQFDFWKNFLLFPQCYSISLKSSTISLTALQSQSGQTLCVERYSRSVMHATSGDHNHCLNFHQCFEFVPLTQLRIELYRSTRTRLINQCLRHNTLIYLSDGLYFNLDQFKAN